MKGVSDERAGKVKRAAAPVFWTVGQEENLFAEITKNKTFSSSHHPDLSSRTFYKNI